MTEDPSPKKRMPGTRAEQIKMLALRLAEIQTRQDLIAGKIGEALGRTGEMTELLQGMAENMESLAVRVKLLEDKLA